MAWDNALNQVISDMFINGPIEQTKFPFFANTKWQDVADSVDQVTLISVSSATIGTYNPAADITYGTGDASKLVLKCDQLKYFADALDDSVKLVGEYAIQYGQKSLAKMALESDKYILGLATKANFPTNWYAGVADAAIDVNGANILAVIDELAEKLDAQNVPAENRVLVVPPALNTKIKRGIVKAGVGVERSADSLFLGKADKVGGFNVVVSNQYVAAAGVYTIFFGHADAIAAAAKAPSIESLRLQNRIADGIRSLMRFGAKVIDEKMGGAAKLKPVAEV